MFTSFMLGAFLIYLFHIFQSAVVQRCYITSSVLLAAWLGSHADDLRTNVFWKSLAVWVVYSNMYFDLHTHWHGYAKTAKQALLCTMPWLAAKGYGKSMLCQLYFWALVVLVPDISSNIYGNAIMSEIKLFVVCMLIMVRFRKRPIVEAMQLENYVWVFFVHDALVALACLQLWLDFSAKKEKLPEHNQDVEPADPAPPDPKPRRRVIDENDLIGFFKH